MRIRINSPFLFLMGTLVLSPVLVSAGTAQFPVGKVAANVIVYDPLGPKLDSISAYLLQQDIMAVTGNRPVVLTSMKKASGNVIALGNISSILIQNLLPSNAPSRKTLPGAWERYALNIRTFQSGPVKKALIISGSDARGTAFGVFSVSQLLGVSPWYWWADAKPRQRSSVVLTITDMVSKTPSVKYRGIFINDEDWGLQPWAAKTFEPETGDIGPKTYAKVFELLLRLKANLIWPAMHPSTKAFYHYPGNKKVAADYEIVIGSSHAEPMARNNVGEWDEKTMGHFNYITNRDQVYNYWESRMRETKDNHMIFSMGMRGVHDSGMEGVKSTQEAIPLLERILEDQRGLISKHVSPDVRSVPQALTVYKEVLDIYNGGLRVPDDVTLVWPDDNYGYIQRLSNSKETLRSGGSGVYYHASYWGRPHDYLWLSTTHPALIREEMTKAYQLNSRRIWVLNVGDIKPAEYPMQLFMDMAWNVAPFLNSSYSKVHLKNWIDKQLNGQQVSACADLLWQYYDLAFERKPEYMGWSQTEPTTQVRPTAYSISNHGDQVQQRIESYQALEKTARRLMPQIDAASQEAYYQLIAYPVIGASLMNKKYLYRDKANAYARQGRLSAASYAAKSNAAYRQIEAETEYFNTKLSGGKWKHIMSMTPRDLPVFDPPKFDTAHSVSKESIGLLVEGNARIGTTMTLPEFNNLLPRAHFVDVFLGKDVLGQYSIAGSSNWISLSRTSGLLRDVGDSSEVRIWVTIDWSKVPPGAKHNGSITVKTDEASYTVNLVANRYAPVKGLSPVFTENNQLITIPAWQFTRKTSGERTWQIIEGLGSTGKSVEAMPLTSKGKSMTDTASIRRYPSIDYMFQTFKQADAKVSVFTLPTHPLHNEAGMRYAVSVDGGSVQVINFKTEGRSEEWKQNVLGNLASRSFSLPGIKPGQHLIRVYMIDAGVILDRIEVNLGDVDRGYGIASAW